MLLRNSAAPARTKKQNCLKFSSVVILLGLRIGGGSWLGGMLRSDFSGDASVLGGVDRVTRVLLLGVTLVLTLGIGVVHLARCQLLRRPPTFQFSFLHPPNKIKNKNLQ
jgi:hypothetical protein